MIACKKYAINLSKSFPNSSQRMTKIPDGTRNFGMESFQQQWLEDEKFGYTKVYLSKYLKTARNVFPK